MGKISWIWEKNCVLLQGKLRKTRGGSLGLEGFLEAADQFQVEHAGGESVGHGIGGV